MDRPWLKFYPRDWRADESLRLCSLAARGLWVECMCLMHHAQPYGHLLVKGMSPSPAQLAALVGATPDQVTELLGELERAGVFSRTATGVVYSRRMTDDDKRRRDGIAAANAGTIPNSRRGRATVEKIEEKLPPQGVVSLPPQGVVEEQPFDPKHPERAKFGAQGSLLQECNSIEIIEEKLPPPPSEYRVQKERKEETSETSSEVCTKRKRVRTPTTDQFEEFWKAYPTDSLMSKKTAFEAFGKLSPEDRIAAVASVPAFVAYCQAHADYRPVHANRYLAQRRFEGFLATKAKLEQQTFVKAETPQWFAWQEFGKRTRGKGYPAVDRAMNGHMVKGWSFPSEWPPERGVRAQ